MTPRKRICLLSSLILLLSPFSVLAGTIPTVPVGHAGNADDPLYTNGWGGVAYDYRIGTTEVTNTQYVNFLNAVAATDTYGLYNPMMGSHTRAGITRTGSSGSYSYSVKADAGSYTYANKPVVFVSSYDALRFANWLHNGQPAGVQDASTTEDGAYTFSGATSVGSRNTGAIWFLPSEDEWYKAAYYDGSSYSKYPTGTDSMPDNNLPSLDSGNSANFYDGGFMTGDSSYPMTDAGAYTLSASHYGTFDQGGNVWEYVETVYNDAYRISRGGSFLADMVYMESAYTAASLLSAENTNGGFRVATVPEPSTAVLAIVGCASMWVLRKRFK